MKRLLVTLLLTGIGTLALSGCPDKKFVPDPTPPKPEVVPEQTWNERVPGYLGREPYVGPRIQFRKMLASHDSEMLKTYF